MGALAQHCLGEGPGKGWRGMSWKRSVWKLRPDGKTVRRNKIGEQFAWQSIKMLESPAWRVLSLSARRVFDRIQIEHAHHGGRENGRLPVTFKDFEGFGIERHGIRPAIAELDALGLIRITQHGRAGTANSASQTSFALRICRRMMGPSRLPMNGGASKRWKRPRTWPDWRDW
jgi:hypothetical protein